MRVYFVLLLSTRSVRLKLRQEHGALGVNCLWAGSRFTDRPSRFFDCVLRSTCLEEGVTVWYRNGVVDMACVAMEEGRGGRVEPEYVVFVKEDVLVGCS